MQINILKDEFSICKIQDISDVPFNDDFLSLSKTDEELSLVCRTQSVPQLTYSAEHGWRVMKIQGVLDFSLIGILSEISTILANNNIGIFVVSTYNTDYILVKSNNILQAEKALSQNGYIIVNP